MTAKYKINNDTPARMYKAVHNIVDSDLRTSPIRDPNGEGWAGKMPKF